MFFGCYFFKVKFYTLEWCNKTFRGVWITTVGSLWVRELVCLDQILSFFIAEKNQKHATIRPDKCQLCVKASK